MDKRKVGILGGTFNPIHIGHLLLAEYAREQLQLEKILIMPSKNPPHKSFTSIVSETHRVEMVKSAIHSNPYLELSCLELKREGTTYTFDTLTILSEQEPETEWFFIVGADSLMHLAEWKHPEIICKKAVIVAAIRDHLSKKVLEKQIDFLTKQYQASILLLHFFTIDIASRDIRKRVSQKKSIRYLVPEEVQQYIMEHHLYQKE